MLAEACSKAATLSNAANGFKAAGIWPMDRVVFSEHDFVASENLNYEQTSQEILHEPAEDWQENDIEEGEKEDEREVIEENLADSPGINRTVCSCSCQCISSKPEPHSSQALRVNKGAQKAEVLF